MYMQNYNLHVLFKVKVNEKCKVYYLVQFCNVYAIRMYFTEFYDDY